MVEIDGRPAEGLHAIFIAGNDLGWSDSGECLCVASETVEEELTPDEFNAIVVSRQYVMLQAISTSKHDFVIVFGPNPLGEFCDD